MNRCANCGNDTSKCQGESSLYAPNRDEGIILCEPCWVKEDDLIERTGTNEHPEIVKQYDNNLNYWKFVPVDYATVGTGENS